MNASVKRYIKENNWIWAAAGALLLWLIMGMVSGLMNLESLVANAYTAAFLAIAAVAQMLVMTTGRGAIDLSIPGVITFSAFVSMSVIDGQDSRFLLGLGVVVLLGVLVGAINSLLVIYLHIPAIIATMAINYILVTAALLINKGFTVFQICPILLGATRNRIAGLPMILYLVVALAVLVVFVLKKTSYGKSLLALGQNIEAARLAGIKTVQVEMLTYVFSSTLAAIAGMLISARVNGAFLGMGDSYMMETVASVVVGGTLVSGGKANTVGTLVGCLFLGLIITTMQIAGFQVGLQYVAKGVLIILVILLGTQSPEKRKKKAA